MKYAVLNEPALAPHNHNQDPELTSLIERIERLEAEKRDRADDIKGLYTEAKAKNYRPKIIRRIIAIRRRNADEQAEEAKLISQYMSAIGMQLDLPWEPKA